MPLSKKLALIVEYDGTGYYGSQFQVGVPTIQGDIENALKKITSEDIRIAFAGRTDAGVHAKGQVVSFSTCSNLSPQSLMRALNHYLRPDIAVKAAMRVQDSFHARRDALSREYRYTIVNSPVPLPLQQRYAYLVPSALDIDSMNDACRHLVGIHDLASFSGAVRKNTVREVYRAEVTKYGELIFFDIMANSFLYRQVRCTVGSLIRVGLGKLTEKEFQEIMLAREPGLASPAAPPQGLCLMNVNYSENKLNEGQSYEYL